MKDVALKANVSVGTVSNVINCPQKVARRTVERVNQAIDELGFTRNETARQLRAGRPDTLGLVIADNSNPFYRELARGAQGVATDSGFAVVIVDLSDGAQADAALASLSTQQHARGLLLACLCRDSRVLALIAAGARAVYVDQAAPTGSSAVSVDNIAGGRLAVEHLASLGRRRIAFIGHDSLGEQVAERWIGAQDAAARVPSASIELVPIASPTVEEGRAAGARLAALPVSARPDAIFAANDLVAMGVMQALNGVIGFSIPRDVSLIGYDDIGIAAAAVVPLTSLRQPSLLMGEIAMQLLVDEIAAGASEARTVVFRPTLVLRESTGIAECRFSELENSPAR